MRDWKLEALVELEDVGRRIALLRDALGQEIRDEQRRYREIINAVRESDEAQASFGQSPSVRSGPNDGPSVPTPGTSVPNLGTPCCDVSPDYAAMTHCVAIPDETVEKIEACGE